MATSDRDQILSWMDALRAAMFDAVTEQDVSEIVSSLVASAKKGDKQAIQLLFNQVIGPANLLARKTVADPELPSTEERQRIERATLLMRESKQRKLAQ